jgi:YHS domain-containing protein
MNNQRIFLTIAALLVLASANAQSVFSQNGKAIRGYDPVAYHTENKAVAGADSLQFSWNGANWFFSSQENLNRFKSELNRHGNSPLLPMTPLRATATRRERRRLDIGRPALFGKTCGL